MNLACRDFHHLVSPVLFRTIHIRFPHDRCSLEYKTQLPLPPTPVAHLVRIFERYREIATTLSSLLEGDIGVQIYSYARNLVLSYATSYDKHIHGELVNRLVENLPNLEIIRYEISLIIEISNNISSSYGYMAWSLFPSAVT